MAAVTGKQKIRVKLSQAVIVRALESIGYPVVRSFNTYYKACIVYTSSQHAALTLCGIDFAQNLTYKSNNVCKHTSLLYILGN